MKPNVPEPIFLSAPKAANYCGVSRNTICCWIRDGKLPSYRTAGGKYLIRPNELIRFMESNQMFVHDALRELAALDERQSGGAPTTGNAMQQNRGFQKEPAILVVEDEPHARAMAVRALQRLNAPILEAENGYEAMHLLTTHPEIAVVILDLVMPGQDGYTTFKLLRKDNKTLPVIVVTGNPPDASEKAFGDEEPDLIITKPYHPSHLTSATSTFMADMGF